MSNNKNQSKRESKRKGDQNRDNQVLRVPNERDIEDIRLDGKKMIIEEEEEEIRTGM